MKDGRVVGKANAMLNLDRTLGSVLRLARRDQGEIPFALDLKGRLYTLDSRARSTLESLGIANAAQDAAQGASAQRCLWASTSTKNPAYRDVLYVEELIGRETVNTMPRETVTAFNDHGRVEDTLERDVDGARRTLEAFAAAGIDYDDVVETLEREGVEKFAKSFEQLFEDVAAKRDALVAA